MTSTTKKCSNCDTEKPFNEFHRNKNAKDGRTSQCKKCNCERVKKYNREHKNEKAECDRKYYEKHKDKKRQKRGCKSMYENKNCPQYLGIVIGERLVRHLFENVTAMPHGNPKFDFICGKDFKIDVKTACMQTIENRRFCWKFHINRNTTADYFICVAFDNRTDLNPIHLWMIPGKELNEKRSRSISLSTIDKWNEWKMDINDAKLCCTEIKKENKRS